MRGLIIKQPWIDYTLDGMKPFEIRTRPTNIRERIGLICAGTGEVWGEANLVGCKFECAYDFVYSYELEGMNDISKRLVDFLRCDKGLLPFNEWLKAVEKKWFIWYFDNIKRYDQPRYYKHPQGAQTWIKSIKFIEEK